MTRKEFSIAKFSRLQKNSNFPRMLVLTSQRIKPTISLIRGLTHDSTQMKKMIITRLTILSINCLMG